MRASYSSMPGIWRLHLLQPCPSGGFRGLREVRYNLPVTSAATDFKIRVIDSIRTATGRPHHPVDQELVHQPTVLKAGSIGCPSPTLRHTT
jgi:hypothetical protein